MAGLGQNLGADAASAARADNHDVRFDDGGLRAGFELEERVRWTVYRLPVRGGVLQPGDLL